VRKLGIKGEELPAGSAEIAVMIPREIFKNDLGTFAKELSFLNRLLNHVGEVLTAEPTPVILGQLSSSDPTLTFETGLAAMKFIGTAIQNFLEAWKKVLEFREILQRLKKVGMGSKANATEITEEITSTVEEVVEESTTDILAHARLEDEGRKNELAGLIRKDLRRLFSQVERGLVMEIRVSPATSDSQYSDPDLGTLKTLSQTLQFPVMTLEPILISSGDLVDDDDVLVASRHHRKTTTTKTTTTKKASSRTKEEPEG
jgi:hypothetical protein